MLRAKNIQNLKTEKEGIIILKSLVDGFMVPDTDQRRFLYEILNIDYKKYSRSIDGVILHVFSFQEVSSAKDFTLVEIKTTNAAGVKELPMVYFLVLQKMKKIFLKQ